MKHGESFVRSHDLSSLKVLGTVGEPINPEAWKWYNEVVGDGKCAIVDTYWQTETGGHILSPLPGATPTKPGSATFPFFGYNYYYQLNVNQLKPMSLRDQASHTNRRWRRNRRSRGRSSRCQGPLAWHHAHRYVYLINFNFNQSINQHLTVYGDHARFESTYFHKFPGYFTTGDGCRRDEDGYYWITGPSIQLDACVYMT